MNASVKGVEHGVHHECNTEQQQVAFAARLASGLSHGLVISLNGDLGAGKTTFVRGFLQGLGYQGIVKSPTYTLVEPYSINGRDIYHFDLYRLADPEEIEYVGGRDYFTDDSISLIEWPEKAAGFLPQADIDIQIDYLDEGRKLTLKSQTSRGEELLLRQFPD